jgi:hypothetical protein
VLEEQASATRARGYAISSETAGALEPDRVARAVGGRASVTCVRADSDCVRQSVEACSRRHGAEARRAILLVARKRARGVLLSALLAV